MSKVLTIDQLRRAEKQLIVTLQKYNYPDEVAALKDGKQVAKSSSLISLRPEMREDIMIVPGRLIRANEPDEVKWPAILPNKHPATEALVRHVHQRTAHAGRGYVVAELRRRYWIPGVTTLVEKVIKGCVACRKRDARTCWQQEY